MKYHLLTIMLFLSLISNSFANESEGLEIEEGSSLDHNGDGQPDLYYKNSKYSYTMFIDRNLDGKPDERYQFDNGTDFMLGGRLDNDFDSYFETQLVMLDNLEIYQLIDSNKDKLIDTVIELTDGVIVSAKKYQASAKPVIVNFSYRFNFPIEKKEKQTELTAKEFHLQAKKLIPSPITRR